MIEADYDTERQQVAANAKIDDAGKETRLRKLGVARLNEIKGVLGVECYTDWQRRIQEAASKDH